MSRRLGGNDLAIAALLLPFSQSELIDRERAYVLGAHCRYDVRACVRAAG
jgi:hypothetical protein